MKIVRLGRLQMKILRLREAPNKEFEDLGPWKGGGLNFFLGGRDFPPLSETCKTYFRATRTPPPPQVGRSSRTVLLEDLIKRSSWTI